MSRHVTIAELSVTERTLPLVGGYLQAYACINPRIAETHRFQKYSVSINTPQARILGDLLAFESDVYAFSCYVWNTGLVKVLLVEILKQRPDAHVVLGGPQVIDHGRTYLSPRYKNLVLCNGEGERTFANYLKELASESPDLANVRGLSFYRGDDLITTDKEEKILDLDEIPSPFLNGLFEKNKYSYAVFETNRGCPYHCSFCYWGLGDIRVSKFSEPRVREELRWLFENGVHALSIGDANWGMLKRDIELSKFIVECKKQTGLPYMLIMNSSKNQPERLVELAEIFQHAGIMTTQSMAVQSLDNETLNVIDRGNIRVSAYAAAQERINALGLSSYVELIWPLPGETLASYKQGVGSMCEMGGQCIITYPLILLNNTAMEARREEHGLITEGEPLGVGSEGELVVATNTVDKQDYLEGLWFNLPVHLLYNGRGLFCLLSYLHDARRATFVEVFESFVDYCRENGDFPLVKFFTDAIHGRGHCAFAFWGTLMHCASHLYRDEVNGFLHHFCCSQEWWDDETQLLFEIDLVNRPYFYSNTRRIETSVPLKYLSVRNEGKLSVIEAAGKCHRFITEYIGTTLGNESDERHSYTVNYEREQMPYIPSQGIEQNANYCYITMNHIRRIMPVWTESANARRAKAVKGAV